MNKSLEQLAMEYAADRLKHYSMPRILIEDVRLLIADAYEQGWADRDTQYLENEPEKVNNTIL